MLTPCLGLSSSGHDLHDFEPQVVQQNEVDLFMKQCCNDVPLRELRLVHGPHASCPWNHYLKSCRDLAEQVGSDHNLLVHCSAKTREKDTLSSPNSTLGSLGSLGQIKPLSGRLREASQVLPCLRPYFPHCLACPCDLKAHDNHSLVQDLKLGQKYIPQIGNFVPLRS